MKHNYIFLLVLLFCGVTVFTATSCKNKKKISTAESAVGATPTDVNTADSSSGEIAPLDGETTEFEEPETSKSAGDSLVMEFSKTPCYGQCPVYNVKVYESGYAVWEGKNFTDRMGVYSTQIAASERQKFFAEAEAEGFFDFDKSYDNSMVQDLPSTSLMIQMDEERHRVTIRMAVPKDVKDYFEGAQEWFENQDWQPVK